MSQWTTQCGFPLIEVVSFDGKEVVLKQSRFLSDGTDDETATLWTIPIFAQTSNMERKLIGLMPAERTFTFSVDESEWIKINAGQYVPCRSVSKSSLNFDTPRLNFYFLTVASCVLEVVIILVETKKF